MVAAAPRARAAGAALCVGAACERTDGIEPGRYGAERADAARAWQGQQGTHRAVRDEGARGAGQILATAGTALAANLRQRRSAEGGAAHQCGVSELRGQAADAAFRGSDSEKVRQAGEHQLGLAPAFLAARICDAFAGGWRGFASDSGAVGAPIAVDDAEIHARLDPATDGNLRQVAPARVSAREGMLERQRS